MRAEDHQLLQPLYVVSVMRKVLDGSVRFGNKGSRYGFKMERYVPLAETSLPTACKMKRADYLMLDFEQD